MIIKVDLLRNLEKLEIEIVGGIYFGRSNYEIAQSSYLTVDTIQNHLTEIYKKLLIFEGNGIQKRERLKLVYKNEFYGLFHLFSELNKDSGDTFAGWLRQPFKWHEIFPEIYPNEKALKKVIKKLSKN